MDLSNMRESYERGQLQESECAAAPTVQFRTWFEAARAKGLAEPNAMTLATVGPEGRPSTRVVLMKSFDDEGIVFFTNYDSRKGQELAANPYAALQFYWPEVEQVVRIEGKVVKISAEESDSYYQARPLDSRIGAWASPQSEVISSRAELLGRAARYAAQFGVRPPRPEHWGGYRLAPDTWEFWQGRTSRLHDRIRYRLVDHVWLKERLAP